MAKQTYITEYCKAYLKLYTELLRCHPTTDVHKICHDNCQLVRTAQLSFSLNFFLLFLAILQKLQQTEDISTP